jgi:hypothetical protein
LGNQQRSLLRGTFNDYYVGSSGPKCGGLIKYKIGMYMAEIKYTEEVFRQLLEDKYGDSYKIVGRYKGYQQPLLL